MSLPWYPFFWGDYSKKTLHLSQSQHGAFLLCLRYIYTTGRPIPHARRHAVGQGFTRSEQADIDYVLESFFERDGDHWRSVKAEGVIHEAHRVHDQQSANGGKGGRKRAENAKRRREQQAGHASSGASSHASSEAQAEAQAGRQAGGNTTTTSQPVPCQEGVQDSPPPPHSQFSQKEDAPARGAADGQGADW